MGLLDCFPQPVALRIGGRLRMVSQLRVRDLAELEAWTANVLAGQLDDVDEPALDRAELGRRLRAAYEAAERAEDSPVIDSAEGRRILFGTVEGMATFLYVVLRAEKPTWGECAEIAEQLTPEEWSAIDRVAFDKDRLRCLERRIDAQIGVVLPPGQGRAWLTWEKAVVDVCERYHYTPAQVGEMYLSQLRILRSGGEPPERGTEIPDGWTREEFLERVQKPRAAFWAS